MTSKARRQRVLLLTVAASGGGRAASRAWRNQNGHFVARQHLNGCARFSAAFGLASGAPLCTPAPVHLACSPCERWRRAETAGPPLARGAARMVILAAGSAKLAAHSFLRHSGSLQALPSIPPRLCISPAARVNGGGERRRQGRLSRVAQPEWPFCRQAAPKWLRALFGGTRARFRRSPLYPRACAYRLQPV